MYKKVISADKILQFHCVKAAPAELSNQLVSESSTYSMHICTCKVKFVLWKEGVKRRHFLQSTSPFCRFHQKPISCEETTCVQRLTCSAKRSHVLLTHAGEIKLLRSPMRLCHSHHYPAGLRVLQMDTASGHQVQQRW